MAAEILSAGGAAVTVYDHMASPARKFLMAGRGGLNLTHSEALEIFITRYGSAAQWLRPVIERFSPQDLQGWCEGLGQPTFIGSSGRVFPKAMKASPLLRAWLQRLERQKVQFRLRRHWLGWDEKGDLRFEIQGKPETVKADATLLALGGASWPRLGSDGSWVEILRHAGVALSSLQPSNCGFTTNWTEHFKNRFQGQPLKTIALSFAGQSVAGELMITAQGVEGGAVYALSAPLREAIARKSRAVLMLDLRPGLACDELLQRLKTPHRGQSLSSYLRKVAGLSPVAIGLLREAGISQSLPLKTPEQQAALIKALPLPLLAVAGMARAISTAGGITQEALDEHFMLRARPGVFAAGEMLDWEAPTGGYLLQASFSTAVAAAQGALEWLKA
jgi:uncharacterized flavoprotein (TIGR03862 family)